MVFSFFASQNKRPYDYMAYVKIEKSGVLI
jgi:hypothetical protein